MRVQRQNSFFWIKKRGNITSACTESSESDSSMQQQQQPAATNDSYRRYICRSNKDAVPASWLRFGRAAKRKIYKKMYTVDADFDAGLPVNHSNLNS